MKPTAVVLHDFSARAFEMGTHTTILNPDDKVEFKGFNEIFGIVSIDGSECVLYFRNVKTEKSMSLHFDATIDRNMYQNALVWIMTNFTPDTRINWFGLDVMASQIIGMYRS